MVTSIYAQVVALPHGFPDAMAVEYQVVNPKGEFIGPCYTSVLETWEQVKTRFRLDANYAKECEGYLTSGNAALLWRPSHIPGEWETINAVTPPSRPTE